ncbi:hypothetical protein [Klebsiella aerogenes]|uniref:hypothetical protein n=1 Tax=Klebsiella aerogenes TaxID=548 RepID=UPI00063C518E|nr:hypothetical protein [Klebsiella aerogenes]KLF59815.1 hypothetical protein YA35_00685 [Klebsiella aerogenes]HDT3686669.1 hypothetical protein [Klebsiella aerogenes]
MYKDKLNLESGYTLLDDGTFRKGHLASHIVKKYKIFDEEQKLIGTARVTVIEETSSPYRETTHVVRWDLDGNVIIDEKFIDD